MIRRLLAIAALAVSFGGAALAQNQLPVIQGPQGYVTPTPVIQVGYDSATGLPCVVGKTTSCQASSSPKNPATVYSGVQTCTTGAVALPSQALVNGIVIQASAGNVGTVFTGPDSVTTANGYALAAGQPISYGVANLSAVYIVCSNATDTVSFTGN